MATVLSIVGSLVADAVLVAIGTHVFPATKGYVHFGFADYANLTVIGVLIAGIAWPVVVRMSSDPAVALLPAGRGGDARPLPARRVDLAPGPIRPGCGRAHGDARGDRPDHLQPAGPPCARTTTGRTRNGGRDGPSATPAPRSYRGANASTSASTSSPGSHWPAATLAAICSGRVAPAMTEATVGAPAANRTPGRAPCGRGARPARRGPPRWRAVRRRADQPPCRPSRRGGSPREAARRPGTCRSGARWPRESRAGRRSPCVRSTPAPRPRARGTRCCTGSAHSRTRGFPAVSRPRPL